MTVRVDGLGMVEELQQGIALLHPSGHDLQVSLPPDTLERLEGLVGLLECVRFVDPLQSLSHRSPVGLPHLGRDILDVIGTTQASSGTSIAWSNASLARFMRPSVIRAMPPEEL